MITRRDTLSALSALPALLAGTAAAQDGAKVQAFEMDDLIQQREDSGRAYLPFLNLPTLRCGLYVLPAGGEDQQNPHETDEVYYTLSGKATIRVEGELNPVTSGSVIYVKAGAEHHFIEIEEELKLLVFFD